MKRLFLSILAVVWGFGIVLSQLLDSASGGVAIHQAESWFTLGVGIFLLIVGVGCSTNEFNARKPTRSLSG